MSTTLNRLKQLPLGNDLTGGAARPELNIEWGTAGRGAPGIPTGNAAYWATLRPVQSPRVSRQGWRAVLDVLRNPSDR